MAWAPALKNHLWWSASTYKGDEVTLIEKWQSVLKHVTMELLDMEYGQNRLS